MDKNKIEILGIPFYNTTQAGFINELIFCHEQGLRKFVVTANPEIVMNARNDDTFKQILLQADYITPDGVGILIGAEKLGTPLQERVTGYDTLVGVLKEAQQKPLSLYFLGAKPEISRELKKRLLIDYPGIRIAGMRHGYFNLEESEQIVEEIIQTKPDFIFVALGSPAQEKWIMAHLQRFSKGIFMGVGGCFDVLSGKVRRAPKWMIQMRMEWMYRLLSNPSRWRRFIALPKYLQEIQKEKRLRK
ncbi:WecB/TagA/CpsF family glycosyltransferase [Listeria sp. PSOL-1]|uniref:WecB/TagA/CpsF family glycosyltransferase n=1 Tax=Listeria sp. PSOL-1 TaxID=1844999 RepID=UPI0013D106C8|nr:WecB/TagA/CpsF family glycosyltransferase [Listeria sp. PSOL-1]